MLVFNLDDMTRLQVMCKWLDKACKKGGDKDVDRGLRMLQVRRIGADWKFYATDGHMLIWLNVKGDGEDPDGEHRYPLDQVLPVLSGLCSVKDVNGELGVSWRQTSRSASSVLSIAPMDKDPIPMENVITPMSETRWKVENEFVYQFLTVSLAMEALVQTYVKTEQTFHRRFREDLAVQFMVTQPNLTMSLVPTKTVMEPYLTARGIVGMNCVMPMDERMTFDPAYLVVIGNLSVKTGFVISEGWMSEERERALPMLRVDADDQSWGAIVMPLRVKE